MLAKFTVVFLLAIGFTFGVSPIPGLHSIGVGFDIVHGKTKLPAVSWTYDGKNTWTNPFTSNSHDVPDQIIVSVASEADLTANIFWTVREYVSSMIEFAGSAGRINIPPTAFSYSTDVVGASTVLVGGEYAFVVVENKFILYEIASIPSSSMKPSETFSSFINALPETYDANSYKNLLDNFGTHYVTQVAIGGKAIMFTQVTAVAAAEIGTQAVLQMALSQFHNITQFAIAGNAAFAAGFEATVDLFSYFSFKGGIFAEIDQYSNWVESIKLAPTSVKYQLAEITDLIPHPMKKEHVRTALTEYYKPKTNNAHKN